MELRLGANVICSDGRQGGKLHFVVLDRTNNTLDDIIVERGFLGARDMTVQASDIGEISPDGQQIDLKINEEELNNRPEYVVGKMVAQATEGGSYTADNGGGFGSTPAASAFGAGGVTGSGIIAGGAGGVPSAIYPIAAMSGPLNDVVQRQPEGLNISDDAPTIKEGARVSDRYDNTIGNVSALTFNNQMQLTALTVKAGFLFTKETVISMDWVETIADTSVRLKYAKEELPEMQVNSDSHLPSIETANNQVQPNFGMADMTSNAYAADTVATTSNFAAPYRDTLASQNATSTNTTNYTTQNSYTTSGKDEAPDIVIRDVPATDYLSGNTNSGQSTTVSGYSSASGSSMSVNSNVSSSMAATDTKSMTDERSNIMSADTNRPIPMGNNEVYGNTGSEDGERGDSNSDMSNRSPLSPATNRIADAIAGDSSDAYSGADTSDQGDNANRGIPEDVAMPPAAVNGIATGNIAPLIPSLNLNNPDGVNNRGV